MGRILDARGDEALDVLAELLEPVGNIAADPVIQKIMGTGGTGSLLDFCKIALKQHKNEVIEIMAIDDGKTADEERKVLSALTIPARFLNLIQIPAVSELLFGLAETETPATGSAAESSSGNG